MDAARKLKEYDIMSDDRGYTIVDIEALPEGQRAELIDGEMFMLASPSATHQAISMWLSVEVFTKIREKNGKCKAFTSPFAVYLTEDGKNYVEPDISVICDRDKLDDKGCHGAPDWIIEIVSASSKRMDYYKKMCAYAESGVREYWIVDPKRKAVVVHRLAEADIPQIYSFNDKVACSVLEDFYIDFSELLDYEYDSEQENTSLS